MSLEIDNQRDLNPWYTVDKIKIKDYCISISLNSIWNQYALLRPNKNKPIFKPQFYYQFSSMDMS